MAANLWTREELIVAFNLYLKLPFGKMHSRNADVIHLATIIGRTPNSVAFRLTNFAAVDPYHQQRGVKGMAGGKKQCQPIWDKFIENKEQLLFESERILAQKEHQTLENKFEDLLFDIKDLKGETKLRAVKVRINQNIFRQIVLSNYSTKCAVSGIDVPDLLVASHILPWASNERERLNPENGICLSSLYDKAFDKGLIGITERFEVLISKDLKKNTAKEYYRKYFAELENKKILLPIRYLPKKEFLQFHLDTVFSKRNG
ncbi:HNH endonuclease [Runella slithyformis]|uniref:Restriction endonuclease n=1 Tax=Runella slithyformis (strain ATCC 29530 / DSM 19594 / LMG 11500 / NCIMB 11436 / LSU 4) TaxID=761193 RepID=A0A7U3ZLH8_RUNSL|nr:HNH endonuclease [Runella slithyformis]AEI49407.1 restriction endonuclease [Runella slithyformis DSM 19594]